jgi:hypothetical protein
MDGRCAADCHHGRAFARHDNRSGRNAELGRSFATRSTGHIHTDIVAHLHMHDRLLGIRSILDEFDFHRFARKSMKLRSTADSPASPRVDENDGESD